MSTTPPRAPDDFNPYATPEARIGPAREDLGTDAEATRRAYLNHEASVKSVGILNFLGAAAMLVLGVISLATAAGLLNAHLHPEGPDSQAARVAIGAAGVVSLAFSGLFLALGLGVRRLQPWARWTEGIVATLAAIGGVVRMASENGPRLNPGLFVAAAVAYLMFTPKSNVVFSRAYKDVIAQTPHIRYKMSVVVKIFLILLLILIVVGIAGVIINTIGGRRN